MHFSWHAVFLSLFFFLRHWREMEGGGKSEKDLSKKIKTKPVRGAGKWTWKREERWRAVGFTSIITLSVRTRNKCVNARVAVDPYDVSAGMSIACTFLVHSGHRIHLIKQLSKTRKKLASLWKSFSFLSFSCIETTHTYYLYILYLFFIIKHEFFVNVSYRK